MSESSETLKSVEQIRTRVLKDQTLRELLGTKDKTAYSLARTMGSDVSPLYAAQLIRYLLNKPTKIAKSEVIAEESLTESVKMKVDQVSSWLRKHGRPPQGEELEASDPSARVDIDDRYYFITDEFGEPRYKDMFIDPLRLFAEEDTPNSKQPETRIKMNFGYDNRYQLEIEFYKGIGGGHYELIGSYDSSVSSLDKITQEEATIVNGVLDGFMESRN
ncbi:hypothetical protein M1437_00790 [Patescibacteria group bacterium]|nr:hypothetical protein [Patescibacteria group bacterium]